MGIVARLARRGGGILSRRLRIETLEQRALLNADWPGFLITDDSGDLFSVDVRDTLTVTHLGTMSTVMFDVAFEPSTGRLFGVDGPAAGPSDLYEIQEFLIA